MSRPDRAVLRLPCIALGGLCAAAVLLPTGRAEASCAAGADYRGDFYTQVGLKPLPSSQLGRAVAGAEQPVCRDTIMVTIDPTGRTVTAAPATDEQAVPLVAREISGVAPRLAIAVRRDTEWTVHLKGSVCAAVAPSRLLACLRRQSLFALQIDRASARPGQTVRVRVRAPKGSETLSAAYSVLIVERAGSWVPLFSLAHGIGALPTRSTRIDPGQEVPQVKLGVLPGTWLPLLVPDVPPGRYRVLHGFGTQRLVADLRVLPS